MHIKSVTDPAFRQYGKIIKGIDCEALQQALMRTPAPDSVVYVASAPELEALPVFEQIKQQLFGGMPAQMGYCNGTNHALNAVEYHRDSEFNYAASDLIMLYGREQDIDWDTHTYDTAKIEAFLVPQGTLIECYATTLHYAPCGIGQNSFRCLVALPKGTNEPLPAPASNEGEERLRTHVNKWLIAHPDSGIEGAHMGLVGENLTV